MLKHFRRQLDAFIATIRCAFYCTWRLVRHGEVLRTFTASWPGGPLMVSASSGSIEDGTLKHHKVFYRYAHYKPHMELVNA